LVHIESVSSVEVAVVAVGVDWVYS
jgi:hypothetical protein